MIVMEIVVLILAVLLLCTNIKSIPTAFNKKKAINVSMSMRNNLLDIQKRYSMLSPQTIQALFYAISFLLVGISIVFDILIYKTAVITTIGQISSINYIMIISMFIHFYFLITFMLQICYICFFCLFVTYFSFLLLCFHRLRYNCFLNKVINLSLLYIYLILSVLFYLLL